MNLDRLAELIFYYGDQIGKLFGSPYSGGLLANGSACMSTKTEYKYLIRGLLFGVERFHYNGSPYMDSIYIHGDHDSRVRLYRKYEPLQQGPWIEVIEEIETILEQIAEQNERDWQAARKKDEEDRQQKIKQTIKEWNEKYGSK